MRGLLELFLLLVVSGVGLALAILPVIGAMYIASRVLPI